MGSAGMSQAPPVLGNWTSRDSDDPSLARLEELLRSIERRAREADEILKEDLATVHRYCERVRRAVREGDAVLAALAIADTVSMLNTIHATDRGIREACEEFARREARSREGAANARKKAARYRERDAVIVAEAKKLKARHPAWRAWRIAGKIYERAGLSRKRAYEIIRPDLNCRSASLSEQ